MEDAKIIDLYWERNEKAIAETEKKYDRYCYSIAQNIVADREDSRECVNDTYLGAWNAIPPTRPNVLRTFLGRITRNLALKKVRLKTADKRGGSQYDLVLEELGDIIADASTPEVEMEAKELGMTINGFLQGLQTEERRVFVCRYWYFDSVSEIAARFGYGESKVKMMLKRTRDKMKEYLKKEGIEI